MGKVCSQGNRNLKIMCVLFFTSNVKTIEQEEHYYYSNHNRATLCLRRCDVVTYTSPHYYH